MVGRRLFSATAERLADRNPESCPRRAAQSRDADGRNRTRVSRSQTESIGDSRAVSTTCGSGWASRLPFPLGEGWGEGGKLSANTVQKKVTPMTQTQSPEPTCK